MLKNNRLHISGVKFGENNAGSHVVFEISYVRNVSDRAMLLDSTENIDAYTYRDSNDCSRIFWGTGLF